MKKNWNELSYEERVNNIKVINETYDFSSQTAEDAAWNVRQGYENDEEWFDFTVTDLDNFESEVEAIIEELYEEEVDIEDIADEQGLTIIETTTGSNGYPQELKKALIGFETFEDALAIADDCGWRVTTFTRKDGWQLWSRDNNTTYQPMQISSADYGDDYMDWDNEEEYLEELKVLMQNAESFAEMREIIESGEKVVDELSIKDDNEIVITCGNRYHETVRKSAMSWQNDGRYYEVGVIKD